MEIKTNGHTNIKSIKKDKTDKTLFGNLSLEAIEAYKLLRTNLNFSLPNEKECRIIGVTSALRGEGKSTTAINLAYTMSQTGQKVLLLEADLRIPNIGTCLELKSSPGISDFLAGQCTVPEMLQYIYSSDDMWVITAGSIPPNPTELLGSVQMDRTLRMLSGEFDAIIVDLPPVMAASDALVASKMLGGIIVVCRQNYCERNALEDAIQKLKYTNCKLLGFVMTDSDVLKKNYGRGCSYKSADWRLDGKN